MLTFLLMCFLGWLAGKFLDGLWDRVHNDPAAQSMACGVACCPGDFEDDDSDDEE